MEEHRVATPEAAASVATVQSKRPAVSLTGIVLGIPLLVYLVTLILPWPEPSGEYARWGWLALGWQMLSLFHYIGLEMMLVLILTTIAVSVASIKSGKSILVTIGLVFLSLSLSSAAMVSAFYAVYYG